MLDYLATRPDVDSKHIVAWGVSYGGHWSALLAYKERARLLGAVVQGGPVHDYYTGPNGRRNPWARPNTCSICSLRAPPFTELSRWTNFMPMARDSP